MLAGGETAAVEVKPREPNELGEELDLEDHHLVVVRGRISDRLFWWCNKCDKRRPDVSLFQEVECR